ncbi:MAG: hypothetical protein AB7O73_13820, partial [Bacteroidia bacterium]
MIKKAITYIILVTILLFGTRKLIYIGILKNDNGYYSKYKHAFFETEYHEVLFLGSSRTAMHFDTEIFDSITNFNSFNLSLSGAGPMVCHAALKAYLSVHKSPRYLLYDPDFHELIHENKQIMDFNNYFPFLTNNVLRTEFSKIDNRMNYFYYLPFYSLPYTTFKNISSSVHGWIGRPEKSAMQFIKGFQKVDDKPKLNFIPTKQVEGVLTVNNLTYIDSII